MSRPYDPKRRADLQIHIDGVYASIDAANVALARSGIRITRVVSLEPQARPVQVQNNVSDGAACNNCGGVLVRTGSCLTCHGCGATGGCG